jgi:hypothetical protein
LICADHLVSDMAWSDTGTCFFKTSHLRGLLLKKLYVAELYQSIISPPCMIQHCQLLQDSMCGFRS